MCTVLTGDLKCRALTMPAGTIHKLDCQQGTQSATMHSRHYEEEEENRLTAAV